MSEITRVTQAGKIIAGIGAPNLRITQMGKIVVGTVPAPSKPELVSPYQDQVAATVVFVTYGESIDPLGGTVWYQSRYKLSTDTLYTNLFTDRLGDDDYEWDISGLTDGTYDFELWATTTGYSSQKNVITFDIHNGMPTAPEITAPYEGQQWTKATHDVEWLAATDPDNDTLTYDARYKKVSASSWTSLFTGETGLSYSWNLAAFDVDDYELEVWADDGDGPGPADHVYFSVFIANQPNTPRIRIVEIGVDYVTVELEAYTHPFSVAWNATKYELIPWGGSYANPVASVTTTDSAYQLTYTFEDLPPGFRGVIRASFEDTATNWSDTAEVYFAIPSTTSDWERRWERNAGWSNAGLGIKGVAGEWGAGYNPQPTSALVQPESESMGSFILEGYVMAGGCYCGWIGRDTELRRLGIGVFKGDSERGGEYGVFFGLDFGVTTIGITGAHTVVPRLWAYYEDCSPSHSIVSGESFEGYSQVTKYVQPAYGQPIGPWVSGFTHYPIYKLELWVQRDLQAETTRVRARANYVGFGGDGFPAADVYMKATATDEWDVDTTLPCLTPCGKPGFFQGQDAYAWPSAYGEYFGLHYTALRDDGLQYVQAVSPLTPYVEEESDTCTPVAEDALADPVFFPAPPNGNVRERWAMPSDVIRARDDTEQRINLREIPVETIQFTTTLLTSREVTQLKALLWEEQPSRWGVPLWMDATALLADLASGSGAIPAASFVSTTRRFEEATHVALWVDQFTWDFLPASFNADGSLTLTGTTSRDYDAFKTQVIPCRVGFMADTAEIPRDAPEIGDLAVTFILEAVDG